MPGSYPVARRCTLAHLSGLVSACLAAFANNTANEDLMAAVPGPGLVLNFCRTRPAASITYASSVCSAAAPVRSCAVIP